MRSSMVDRGPSGRFQLAPCTCRHHGAAETDLVSGVSPGRIPAKTNDQPYFSASVTYFVVPTNVLNLVFETAQLSIQKGFNWICRMGPSPSDGHPRGSSVPNRNVPPGRRPIPSVVSGSLGVGA